MPLLKLGCRFQGKKKIISNLTLRKTKKKTISKDGKHPPTGLIPHTHTHTRRDNHNYMYKGWLARAQFSFLSLSIATDKQHCTVYDISSGKRTKSNTNIRWIIIELNGCDSSLKTIT